MSSGTTDLALGAWAPPPAGKRHEFFMEHGWVQVDDVISNDEVNAVRAEVLRMLKQGVTNVDHHFEDLATDEYARLGEVVNEPSRFSELMRDFATSKKIGDLMREVMGVAEIRLFRDLGINKLPTSQAGIQTGIHQDLPNYPIRTEIEAAVWIALTDLPANSGTLRWLDGSHRMGELGIWVLPGKDWLVEHPEDEAKLTAPPAMRAGSATIHHGYTLHGTDPNLSGMPRLGLTLAFCSAEATFTGGASRWTDELGLEVDKPLDHPFFPIAG